MNKVICSYCGEEAKFVKGDVIYPHRKDLKCLNFYMCENNHDRAYVGCHKGTTSPLGRLANSQLRRCKMNAHAAFDPIWKDNHMTRSAAYSFLADKLGIKGESCHIGMFDCATCIRVQKIASNFLSGLSD